MKRLTITFIAFLTMLIACNNQVKDHTVPRTVVPEWTTELSGDFSFKEEWSYLEGIERNEVGQLVCDGLCNNRSYELLDERGHILKDSVNLYYQLIDTSHLFHSIESEAWAYEFMGTNFMEFYKEGSGKVKGMTMNNAATHSTLVLLIEKDYCKATIELNSVTDKDKEVFTCRNGWIKIDETLWNKQIAKTEFAFEFHNHLEPKKRMYWEGKTYAPIYWLD